MRKQTKLVAVASAAALLAVGASMTSFAATGWVEEDGVWYFYDKDGNRVEDAWKKSGDNWYWLDSEEGGAMAIDKLIEDGDETYYVDSNGVMVRNTWVKVVNEDQDDETDPAEYIYYYMQSNGKAYKTKSDTTQFKTIDGKRYAFDEDGKMLYGWIDDSHERVDDDSWDEGVYYLGQWDDGAMKTGWQKIYVEENEGEDEGEDKEFWFNFQSNGKKRKSSDADKVVEKKINGKKYAFDNRGVMTSQWTISASVSVAETVRGTDSNGNTVYAANSGLWRYYSSPEDGARATKGWFKVVAPEEDNDNTFKDYGENYSFAIGDADDENERWYYADGNGDLYSGQIKKIKGKYYGFRPEGSKAAAMLTGLVFISVDNDGNITKVWDDDVDADELDDIIDGELYDSTWDGNPYADPNTTLYYFGNDEDHDGALKTGNVTINLDGESYNFYFTKSGGAEGKGKGVTGLDDDKYVYKYGLKIKADSDDKYEVVQVYNTLGGALDIGSDGVRVRKVDSQDLRAAATELGQNKDGDTVSAVLGFDNDGNPTTWDSMYYLVNTSGAVSKKKSAAKDGNDWYFYVNKDKRIVMYTNNKSFKSDKDHTDLDPANLGYDLDKWDKWTNGDFTP